jgi:hypothetical protein
MPAGDPLTWHEATRQAMEELSDNLEHLRKIHRYCTGWKVHNDLPQSGQTTIVKEWKLAGGGGRLVLRVLVVMPQVGHPEIEFITV